MKPSLITIVVIASLASHLGTSQASAEELPACGGIYLNGNIQCELREEEECMTQCVTVAVEASCAAQLYTQCEGGCVATASAECEAQCVPICVNDCDVPALPSCTELCEADCDASCRAECGGDGPCDACEAKCASACAGSCVAQANTQCQIGCQADLYLACEQQMVQRCQTECETSGAAIFCNGQFVSADDIDACAQQLADEIDVHVDAQVDADVDANVDCSVTNVGAGSGRGGPPVMGAMLLLGLLGGLARHRRREGELR
jgi:MYXO-CTERM domain-containing protein